ncbi:hypothetical protein CGRA01v4_10520 [Colletotrichum graminicola]|nr:hypothetical protein CGRA01v4_10520 [Colletotrichum graminicola]
MTRAYEACSVASSETTYACGLCDRLVSNSFQILLRFMDAPGSRVRCLNLVFIYDSVILGSQLGKLCLILIRLEPPTGCVLLSYFHLSTSLSSMYSRDVSQVEELEDRPGCFTHQHAKCHELEHTAGHKRIQV